MDTLNTILWSIATVLLLSSGIYFTIKLKGLQFNIKKIIKSFKAKTNSAITPFASLMMATSARIGVGSLAGISLAIIYGGPGTVFWIWVTTLIVAINSFAESTLGVLYQEKDGEYRKGGPAYYLKKGLNNKKLGNLYALLTFFTYIVAFMTIQANTITVSITSKFAINPIVIAILIAVISLYVILNGIKRITKFTNNLVPIMGIGYIMIGLTIILSNIEQIPAVFSSIFNHALNIKSFGVGILSTLLIGVQRGIFSNEAGIGTGAIASGSVDNEKAGNQGLIQVVGVYFTSLIICTITALIILTSDYSEFLTGSYNGIEVIQKSMKTNLGNFGEIGLIIIITLFAFSTIITGYYYGESNFKYLFKKHKKHHLYLIKSVVTILLLWGSLANPSILWDIVDILVAILAIINIYALYGLRKEIIHQSKRL